MYFINAMINARVYYQNDPSTIAKLPIWSSTIFRAQLSSLTLKILTNLVLRLFCR